MPVGINSEGPSKTIQERNIAYFERLVRQRRHELELAHRRRLELESEGNPDPTPADSQTYHRTSCVFDGMTAAEVKEAFTHFHTNPQDLPEKEHSGETPPWLQGKQIGPDVEFDEGIFEQRLYWTPKQCITDEQVSPKTR